jgi:1-phosphofructokinase family hexose kinase
MLAAGLSSALQRVLVLDRLRPGRVQRLTAAHVFAAGKAVHAARAWRAMGEPGRLVTVAGGPGGQAFREELSGLGLALELVPTDRPLRVCTTLLEREGERTTELVEEAPPLDASELTAFEALFRSQVRDGEPVVLSGSLPRGTPADFYLGRCREARGPVVLDARGPELLAALPARPWLVKPNREELAATLERGLGRETEVWRAMRGIQEGGACAVLVSDGPLPALLLTEAGRFRLHPPRLRALNPIGSGDCLAAGLALGAARGLALVEAARLGMGMAAASAEVLAPAGFTPARAAELAARVRIEERTRTGKHT